MKTKRRIISFFLVFCMLMTCMPDTLVYAEESTFSGGSGTENDPYLLANAADFKKLATDVNGGTAYAGTYFMVSDSVSAPIELSSEDGFVPIGNNTTNFQGTFDGNGKTIQLSVDLTATSGSYAGLFGYAGDSSVVKNVTTTGTVKASSFVGGIAGKSMGKCINCHNEADVTSTTTSDAYAGGVIGRAANIDSCTNRGSVSASGDYVGGIAGFSSALVESCTNHGSVSSSGTYYVGGILGQTSFLIENCTNRGLVSASANQVGGIVGGLSGIVINCLNIGSVTGKDKVGGIAGETSSTGQITNCVNNADITKTDDAGNAVGGIVGTLGGSTSIEECYYNQTINSGLCDAGESNGVKVTSTECAVAEEKIVSETVIDALNTYAKNNKPGGRELLCWKVEEGVISLVSEAPSYQITNNATAYITVAESAKAGETVTVTAAKEYLRVTSVTVTDKSSNALIASETETGYSFTMPSCDVTVSATADINLTQTDGVYQISTADEMKIFSAAVNDGYDTLRVFSLLRMYLFHPRKALSRLVILQIISRVVLMGKAGQ